MVKKQIAAGSRLPALLVTTAVLAAAVLGGVLWHSVAHGPRAGTTRPAALKGHPAAEVSEPAPGERQLIATAHGSAAEVHRYAATVAPEEPGPNEAVVEPATTQPKTQSDAAMQVANLRLLYHAAAMRDKSSIAEDLGQVSSPEAGRTMFQLLGSETNPEMRIALIRSMSGSPALEAMGGSALEQIKNAYSSLDSLPDRTELQNAVAAEGDAAGADFLRSIYHDENADPMERLNAAENLMRLNVSSSELVSDEEVQAMEYDLRLQAQAEQGNPDFQTQALMALGSRREENRAFFQGMLQAETDANVRLLLAKLLR